MKIIVDFSAAWEYIKLAVGAFVTADYVTQFETYQAALDALRRLME